MLVGLSGSEHSDGSGSAEDIGAASHGLTARLAAALPDASRLTLDTVSTAERALVLGVLGHLHLLDDLPQRTTVPGSVLTDNTSLSRVLGHIYLEESRGATNQSKREGEG